MDGAPSTLAALNRIRRLVSATSGAPEAIRVLTDETRGLLGVEVARTTIVGEDGGRTDAVAALRGRGVTDDRLRRPARTAPVLARDGNVIGEVAIGGHVDGRPIDAIDEAILASLAVVAADVIEHDSIAERLRAIVDHAPAAMFLKDRELRYLVANQRAAELAGAASPEQLIGRTDEEFLDPAAAAAIMASDRAILSGAGDLDDEAVNVLPGGEAILHAQIFAIRDRFGRPTAIGGVVSDVTERRLAEAALAASEHRYRLLFEQALDGIVLADDEGRYIDANPAACSMLGLTHDEVIGRSVHDVVVDAPTVWSAYRSATSDDGVVRGDVTFHRPDGTTVTAEYTASPFAADGLNVGMLRDVTEQRRREAEGRARLAVIGAIRAVVNRDDINTAAATIGRAIVDHGGFAGAGVFAFTGRSSVDLIDAQLDDRDAPVARGARLPPAIGRRVRRRVLSGPWVDPWTDLAAPLLGVDMGRLAAVGVQSSVCLPLERAGVAVGMLAIAATLTPAELEARLPDVTEFADLAAARLGAALARRSAIDADRRVVRRIIERHAFRPVFQPIVDLETRETLGYEGLTRFADGTPPDERFALAHAAGVGRDLEIATLETILDASGPLPANRYLDINVSPDLILAREPLRSLLRDAGFNVVVEITEHDAVADYAAMRAAIDALGDHVSLAVDDAGAGFASLRHVIELRPDAVKLDRALIAGIDRDPARQAMVAGLTEFATRLGVGLVAEGVELEAERQTLLDLGVRRAQGYLFGRPLPVAEVLATRTRRD